MKKLIAFLGLFAMVLVALPCKVAKADTELPEAFATAKSKVDTFLTTKYDLSEYPYWFIQKVKVDASKKVVYYDVMYCKYPMVVDTKYSKGYLLANNCIDNGSYRINQNTTDMIGCEYNANLGTVSSTIYPAKTLRRAETANIESGYYSEIEEYASHNIYNLDTGELVFRGAPHLTELAKIVEQSNRQQNPMFQVISLLPLGISLVVSFLALRKCLQMLRTTLFRA